MCNPAAAAILTVAQMGQAAVNNKAQARFQKQQADFNAKIAQNNAFNQYAAIDLRSIQEKQAETESLNKNAELAAQALSTAQVNAAEAGVSGASVSSLMNSYVNKETAMKVASERNLRMRDSQMAAEKEAARYGQWSSMINTRPGPITQPNYLGMILQGYGTYQDWKKNNPETPGAG